MGDRTGYPVLHRRKMGKFGACRIAFFEKRALSALPFGRRRDAAIHFALVQGARAPLAFWNLRSGGNDSPDPVGVSLKRVLVQSLGRIRSSVFWPGIVIPAMNAIGPQEGRFAPVPSLGRVGIDLCEHLGRAIAGAVVIGMVLHRSVGLVSLDTRFIPAKGLEIRPEQVGSGHDIPGRQRNAYSIFLHDKTSWICPKTRTSIPMGMMGLGQRAKSARLKPPRPKSTR